MQHKYNYLRNCAFAATMLATPLAATASFTLVESGDRYLEIGGRMQIQYQSVDPETRGAESSDDLFFRRLRLYVAGSLTEDIKGIWQVDFGSDEQDADTKDAYIQYTGFDWGVITVGNQYVPFSREVLTSSKRQQLVERTLVGNHNFGVPDRQLGVTLSGGDDWFQYTVGGFKAGIDNSINRIDFESPVSQPTDGDFYVGNLLAGRLNWTPLGDFKMAQGAFGSPTRFALGVNAYAWSNDGDTVDPAKDGTANDGRLYDDIKGFGVDAAFRSGYWSVDAAYQVYSAKSVDPGFSGGLIESGEADFVTYMVKGGYMVLPGTLETVASYTVLDAEAYAEEGQRVAFGLNWFLNGHKDKIQLTYELGYDVISTQGNTAIGDDQSVLYLQFQHVL